MKDAQMENEIFAVINLLEFVHAQKIEVNSKDQSELFERVFKTALRQFLGRMKCRPCKQYLFDYALEWCDSNADAELCEKSFVAIKRRLFFNSADWRLLAALEILFVYKAICEKMDEDLNEFLLSQKEIGVDLLSIFSLKKKCLGEIFIFIENGAIQLKGLEKIRNKKIRSAVSSLLEFNAEEKRCRALPVFNIAVCATMSAGKSTFVNALLGDDYLPARCEATTARIATVYDKDGLKKMYGFSCEGSVPCELDCDVNAQKLNAWNSNARVSRIYMQSDLDGISNRKAVLAVHDTPGANNSQDTSHYNVTMNFLTATELDIIIYVANYEHLLTTDENALLKQVAKVVAKKNIQVLFAINKVDSYDKEKEDFSKTMQVFVRNVELLGFKNFVIAPVAAKPARLFKMALKKNVERFSESECDAFESFFNKFTKRMNINKLSPVPARQEDFQTYKVGENSKVEIDGQKYDAPLIRQALFNTGIIALEKVIENIIVIK